MGAASQPGAENVTDVQTFASTISRPLATSTAAAGSSNGSFVVVYPL